MAAGWLEHGKADEARRLLEKELVGLGSVPAAGTYADDPRVKAQRRVAMQIFLAALSEEGLRTAREKPHWQPIIFDLERRAEHQRSIQLSDRLEFQAALALRKGDPAPAIEVYDLLRRMCYESGRLISEQPAEYGFYTGYMRLLEEEEKVPPQPQRK